MIGRIKLLLNFVTSITKLFTYSISKMNILHICVDIKILLSNSSVNNPIVSFIKFKIHLIEEMMTLKKLN